MSIIYCEKHDRRWDSDFKEDCPMCENEPNPSLLEILRLIPQWYEGGTWRQMFDEAVAQTRLWWSRR